MLERWGGAMNPAAISAVSGGLAALERLDAIATNLANVGTTGFKSLLHLQQASAPAGGGATAGESLTHSSVGTAFSQGPLEHTGDPLNVALSGEGFFVVDTPEGERLTRRGALQLDEQGVLVTSEGHRVQGDGGEIQLGDAIAQGEAVTIGTDGTVSAGTASLGRLRVVLAADEQALQRDDSGLWIAKAGSTAEAEPGTFEVVQGALEASNVSPVESLVQMIEATRAFEAYMTAVQRMDRLQQSAIDEVGRVA